MDSSPKTAFFTLLLYCAGITLVILVSLHVMMSALVSIQLEKNIQRHLLISEKNINILQYEKRQGKIMDSRARLYFITSLRRQNEEAALILKELEKATPKSITFLNVQWQNRIIQVKGYARSDSELVTWMSAIGQSSVLTHPVMTSSMDKNGVKYFELKMGLAS